MKERMGEYGYRAKITGGSEKENLVFGQDGFELLQDILEDAGELKERTPYAELVNTEFAKNAS